MNYHLEAMSLDTQVICLQSFLGRYGVMLENGGKDPTTPAGRELRTTVLDRRQEEARAAMFSDWASASYAWNKEETAQGGMSPPSVDFWTQILVRSFDVPAGRVLTSMAFKQSAMAGKRSIHLASIVLLSRYLSKI